MKPVIISIFVAGILFPALAYATTVPERYTDTNFASTYHDMPLTFSQDALGNFSGVTVSGKQFTQTRLVFSISVQLQRFAIDDVQFYISGKGIIEAETDLEALSIYLTLVA